MANRFLGVADSATKLAAARSITLTGNVTGTANFDGSSNVSMGTNLALYITLGDGNGGGILQNGGTVWQRLSILDDAVAGNGVFSFQQSMDSGTTWKDLLIVNDDGNVLASKFTGTLAGNATSSTFLTVNNTEVKNLGRLQYFQGSSNATLYPDTSWWSLIRAQHPGYADGYWQELALGFTNSATNKGIKYRTNVNGTLSAWRDVALLDQARGYWGFYFPENNTYLRTPPNGLLPDAAGNPSGSSIGTSTWRFNHGYINEIYGTLYGNATSATTATNATKLNNQDAAYYLNYNNFTNKPLDRELVNFYNAPSNTTLNIPVIFGQSSTATTYNKIGFSRWQQGDPYGLGLGSYGNIIGWHGDDTGSFLATAYNAPVVMIGGINGTANQYKNWQRKVCLYGEDGVSFTSSNSNALGGVAAANYVNTSDTVILVGTI